MALTNQQVQAAYLAIIGRPAEGSAVTWASASFADLASLVSSIIDIRKSGDFENNKETFVENLYTGLLGRAPDAEGKEYWLKALNDGVSYAQVAQEFINAVLGQSQTADLYTLQNRLGVAEKISAQINTFQGGATAEATLKELMSTVNANTTFANVEDSVKEFKGQNVDIANVTVKQGADKPAEGSDEHATVFNATLDVTADDGIAINGSKNFAETLNLTIKGDAESKNSKIATTVFKDIKNVDIYKIEADNVAEIALNVGGTGNPKELSISGKSDDKITVAGAATVKTGNGDDEITVTAAAGKKVVVNGGNGTDTVKLGTAAPTTDFTKLSLTNIEKLDGKGMLSYDTLNQASFELTGATTELAVTARSGIDLSSITNTGNASKIAINGVKSGTVTLSATDQSIGETVKALEAAKDLNVVHFTTGDKIDFTANAAIAAISGNAGNNQFISKAASVALGDANKAILISDPADTAREAAAAIKTHAATASSNYIVAVNNTDSNGSFLYLVKAGAGNTTIEDEELTLLATLDHTITHSSANYTFTAGVLAINA